MSSNNIGQAWNLKKPHCSPTINQLSGIAESAVRNIEATNQTATYGNHFLITKGMDISPVQRLVSRRTRHSLLAAKSLLTQKAVVGVTDKIVFYRPKS